MRDVNAQNGRFWSSICRCHFSLTMLNKWQPFLLPLFLRLSNAFLLFSFFTSMVASSKLSIPETPKPIQNLTLPSDALALLDFKSKADLNTNLTFSSNSTTHFCKWPGVECDQSKIVRLLLGGLDLGGVFAPNTLTRLDQLRVLSLQSNSLTGPIPDLSGLKNLKSLFLDHNFFTGSFPPSIISLHRLRTIDLSHNNLTGSIPTWLTEISQLFYVRLEWNHFNGSVPALNQSSLTNFNVSGNNFTGAIPVTPTFLGFGASAFLWNPSLCGEIIHKECHPRPPFFRPTASGSAPSPALALSEGAKSNGAVQWASKPFEKKHKRTTVIIGFLCGVFVLICSILCFVMVVKKQNYHRGSTKDADNPMSTSDIAATTEALAAMQKEQEKELDQKVKNMQGMQVAKSGILAFCAGEAQLYTLDQLMKATAELLGRGTMGSTYKAVLDNRLIVCVKRLDAAKLGGTSREFFEQHMESVGGLRHPNLVPLRAYFQAKEERLLVYDYQPNGSLFSLIHGSKSTRAKPLHWTSCLKIAEDVAQGLSYIHQAWRLVHGNLKSSNVLLGSDFEACVVDYCLSLIATTSLLSEIDPDSAAYRAPEIRNNKKPSYEANSKSDVFAYGVLLVELLTGKPPSEHPFLEPDDMMDWIRYSRERGDDDGEDSKMEMLAEVALSCSLTSPEQRPNMWQVLKMLQEVKDIVLMENSELDLLRP